jgi:hypothetical protein
MATRDPLTIPAAKHRNLDRPAVVRQGRYMQIPQRDTLGIGCLMLAAILTVWLGVAGPVFSIDPRKLNETAGIAAWVQVLVAAVAIVGVYIAATIPVRAENERRTQELRLRRQGLALLIIPELGALMGEMERAIDPGSIYDPPIQPPTSLVERLDDLYILGRVGGRLLQTVGGLRAMATQPLIFQASGMRDGAPEPDLVSIGQAAWSNNIKGLELSR